MDRQQIEPCAAAKDVRSRLGAAQSLDVRLTPLMEYRTAGADRSSRVAPATGVAPLKAHSSAARPKRRGSLTVERCVVAAPRDPPEVFRATADIRMAYATFAVLWRVAFAKNCQDGAVSQHRFPYQSFKGALNASWKAKKLWQLLDRRIARPEYRSAPCKGLRTLVVGAGPCGLRAAIELRLLGAEVVPGNDGGSALGGSSNMGRSWGGGSGKKSEVRKARRPKFGRDRSHGARIWTNIGCVLFIDGIPDS